MKSHFLFGATGWSGPGVCVFLLLYYLRELKMPGPSPGPLKKRLLAVGGARPGPGQETIQQTAAKLRHDDFHGFSPRTSRPASRDEMMAMPSLPLTSGSVGMDEGTLPASHL